MSSSCRGSDPSFTLLVSENLIQRFGGSVNLNVHFHVTALDGVFARDAQGRIAFHEAPVPTTKQITVLCSVLRLKVLELLKAQGFLSLEGNSDLDSFAQDEPLLASIAGASLSSRIASF